MQWEFLWLWIWPDETVHLLAAVVANHNILFLKRRKNEILDETATNPTWVLARCHVRPNYTDKNRNLWIEC